MKTEIQHFTEAPEIQHFAVVKVNKNDNVYGVTWGDVVREYLKTSYSEGNTQADVISYGKKYKVLKRESVTVFYDADGNTLFDVENKRLEKEYGYVMKEQQNITDPVKESNNASESVEKKCITGKNKSGLCGAAACCIEEVECCSKCENSCNSRCGWLDEQDQLEDNTVAPVAATEEEKENITDNGADDLIPIGTASLKEIGTGLPAPTAEKIATAKEENDKPVKQRAQEKLEKEMKDAKDKTFAEPVIGHLLKRCEEDNGLAQDVMQEHKTWEKCYKYIFEQARKQARGNGAAIRDEVVYEWAEDYYHKDDKAEEEKKAKEAAERKKKEEERKKKAAEQKKAGKRNPKQGAKREKKAEEKPAEPPKPKKNPKEIDGQMDLFSMMGM